jgi:hypothetical protein
MKRCLPEVQEFRYREQPGRWRFVLEEDLAIRLADGNWGRWRFLDACGEERLAVDGLYWIIRKGYAWDGASPKGYFLGRHWGTPDFGFTRAATSWHDAAGQFRHLQPLRRLTTGLWHRIFRDIIVSEGGRATGPIYHLGLQLFNPLYHAASRAPKTGSYERL